jgi:hypothetical protein
MRVGSGLLLARAGVNSYLASRMLFPSMSSARGRDGFARRDSAVSRGGIAMIRRAITAMAMAAALVGALATPSAAQVSINIHLPGPPQLVVVPSSPVQYVVNADANLFYYAGQYYVFSGGIWYVSPRYTGPWFIVEPEFVPQPILYVPVRYYRRPPTAWRVWVHDAPPRWEARYGHRWQERRDTGWRDDGRRDNDRRDDGAASPRWDRRDDPPRMEQRRDDRRDDRDRHDDRDRRDDKRDKK